MNRLARHLRARTRSLVRLGIAVLLLGSSAVFLSGNVPAPSSGSDELSVAEDLALAWAHEFCAKATARGVVSSCQAEVYGRHRGVDGVSFIAVAFAGETSRGPAAISYTIYVKDGVIVSVE
jgi:hypothetical protein